MIPFPCGSRFRGSFSYCGNGRKQYNTYINNISSFYLFLAALAFEALFLTAVMVVIRHVPAIVYMYVCMYVLMHTYYMYVCMNVPAIVYMYASIHTYKHTYICMYMYVCMYVCV